MAQLGQARKAKLSIPPVQKLGPKQALRGGMAGGARPVHATAPHTAATSPGQPGNAAAPAPTQPTDPFKAAAPASGQPRGQFDLPSYTPAPGETDPRDATYWANVTKLKFNDEQEYAQVLREQQRADTDYSDAVQTALRNRLGQQRDLGESAIRGNLGASGWLNRNEADQTGAYTQERAHALKNKQEDDQGRSAAKGALAQGFQLDAGTQLAEAIGRLAASRESQSAEAAPEIPAAPVNVISGYDPSHPVYAKAFAKAIKKGKK